MAVLAAIVVAATLLEDDHLFALGLSDDFGRNRNLAHVRQFTAVTGKKNITERDSFTSFTSQLFNCDLVSGGDPILLAARAHYCEHATCIHSTAMPPRLDPLLNHERRAARLQGAGKMGAVSVMPCSCQRRACAFRNWLERSGRRAMACYMTLNKSLIPLGAAVFLLAGCAKDQDKYPSLSIRDAERVGGTFQPVEPEPFVPAPQTTQALQQIDSLQASAQEVHGRFTAAAERTRVQVRSASGAGRDSEAWLAAQVAIANLESIRSEAMIPLATLDRILTDAQTAEQSTTEAEAARNEVEALVNAEDAAITALISALGG